MFIYQECIIIIWEIILIIQSLHNPNTNVNMNDYMIAVDINYITSYNWSIKSSMSHYDVSNTNGVRQYG
jgi:hypothetical protein